MKKPDDAKQRPVLVYEASPIRKGHLRPILSPRPDQAPV